MQKVKVLFLSATRADFGKLKSLIQAVLNHPDLFIVELIVTGMHLSVQHGNTYNEIQKSFPELRLHIFSNRNSGNQMEISLAKSIEGISKVLDETSPDLLLIHGDRIETLAGAVTAAIKNVLVAHVEGGEVSGTIDELMRHATSKMAHIHFVANEKAKNLLIQMGEFPETIQVIGSPDLDLIDPEKLPDLHSVKERYGIIFDNYSIVLLHPVTTNFNETKLNTLALVDFINRSPRENFVIIGPNNDRWADLIWDSFQKLSALNNVLFFPSIRFEYFLRLFSEAKYIVGNSSAGIREAPYLGVPCINIGSRQNKRSNSSLIVQVDRPSFSKLERATITAAKLSRKPEQTFGDGNSHERFIEYLMSMKWKSISHQKTFNNLDQS